MFDKALMVNEICKCILKRPSLALTYMKFSSICNESVIYCQLTKQIKYALVKLVANNLNMLDLFLKFCIKCIHVNTPK